MTHSPNFESEINQNRLSERVSDSTETINKGQSQLTIRARGAFITDCQLTSPGSNEVAPVLYSDSDTTVAKLSASHPMSPVGPYEGLGGQHGFPRWADYHFYGLPNHPDGQKRIALQSMRSDMGESLTRLIELADSSLTIHSTLRNENEVSVSTSIGEHMYFAMPQTDIDGLKINGQTLTELLGDEEAIEKIKHGEPFFWSSFMGNAIVDFADGKTIGMSSQLTFGERLDDAKNIGMLIWHRPKTDSICLEPVAGFDYNNGKPVNNGLLLLGYNSLTLATKIELLGLAV